MKIIAQNKKAFFDYHILDTLEVGMVLTGDEVKALRAGHGSLIGAFAHIKNGELFLVNAHITPYEKAYAKRTDMAERTRKLLVHRAELNRLVGETATKGVTLVPLKIYLDKNSRFKLELGLCKHKNVASKKEAIKERDIKRQTSKELKDVYKYK